MVLDPLVVQDSRRRFDDPLKSSEEEVGGGRSREVEKEGTSRFDDVEPDVGRDEGERKEEEVGEKHGGWGLEWMQQELGLLVG